MSSVIFDISMSLDGFLKASNATPEQPLDNGGERLHEWAFGEDDCDREVLAGGVEGSGALIAGPVPTTTRFGGAPTARAHRPGCSSSPTRRPRPSPKGASTPSSRTASKARSIRRRRPPGTRTSP